MKTDLFDFFLPDKLIAAYPSENRGEDRLMVVQRQGGIILQKQFADLNEFLMEGDLLVFNDVRVHKARLFAAKPTGGRVEILLLEQQDACTWHCLTGSSRPVKAHTRLQFSGDVFGVIKGRTLEGLCILEFEQSLDDATLDAMGHMPLPPYILKQRGAADELDDERYQTVYAKQGRAVAAPTAGLHFTEELLDVLRKKGVGEAYLTLNVGWGTFAPVKSEAVETHSMHCERFIIPEATALAVNRAREEKRRVIAVGTTVVRALESAFDGESGGVVPGDSSTEIFIKPGYEFRAIDGMVTNFHTPRSTLLMMVSAFSGYELIMQAYREAVEAEFRFFSYGDAMLLL